VTDDSFRAGSTFPITVAVGKAGAEP